MSRRCWVSYDAAAVVVGRGLSVIALALGIVGCSGSAGSHPSSADDGVVLQVVPDASGQSDDVRFAAVPDLLVTDDGRAIYAPPAEYAVDGALVPDVWVAAVSPAGVELVRDAVHAGGPPQNIDELSTLVGSELADVDYYVPEIYRFAAVEFGPAANFDARDTPVLRWPKAASVALADAAACTRLPELEVGEVLVTAAENSVFLDDGVIYGVVAAPDWPGAPC